MTIFMIAFGRCNCFFWAKMQKFIGHINIPMYIVPSRQSLGHDTGTCWEGAYSTMALKRTPAINSKILYNKHLPQNYLQEQQLHPIRNQKFAHKGQSSTSWKTCLFNTQYTMTGRISFSLSCRHIHTQMHAKTHTSQTHAGHTHAQMHAHAQETLSIYHQWKSSKGEDLRQ